MASSKPTLKEHMKLRRRWLTWLRMARYGANNFTRNAWLTTAATAVMTITLLIIFTTYTARNILTETVDEFRQKINISIFLRDDITSKEVVDMRAKLTKIDNVVSVRLISVEEARTAYIKKYNPSPDLLQVIAELPTSPFPQTFRVVVKDPNDLAELEKLVREDAAFKDGLNEDPRLAPTFATSTRGAIENLGRWINTVDRIGLVMACIFVGMSMLIIFNTIRMAIFTRRDEIEMMKLIGADRGFIRGPFVVEAVMYGFFAAIFATVIGFAGLIFLEPKLQSYVGVATSTKDTLITFAPVVLLVMIAIGALIGNISSRLAVRRYLKV